MPYETVQEPARFPEAFRRLDDAAVQTQAASLLFLGNLLRFEDPRTQDPLTFEAMSAEQAMPDEDWRELGLPEHLLAFQALRGARFETGFVREALLNLDARLDDWSAPDEMAVRAAAVLPDLAERLAERPDPVAAAELCRAALAHPDELVRVAAATCYLEVVYPQPDARVVDVLVQGTSSEEPLVRDVAATALARVLPGHPRLLELITPPEEVLGEEPSQTSLLVHGTWARRNTWWQPGHPGNFHDYLRTNVDPDLYAASDRFDWTGAYSHAARLTGGIELKRWVDLHSLDGLDLFAHSHGGNVAMVASRAGTRIGRLVLLSCPAHKALYLPDFSRVGRVFAISVRLDLVVLADGGGQRFDEPGIEDIKLPIWFNHSATHERAVWIDHDLPARIA